MPSRLGIGWWRAGVVMGLIGLLAAPGLAAERDTYQSARDAAAEAKAKARKESGSWWSRLWPFGSKAEPKPEPKATSKSTTTAKKPPENAAQTRPVSAPLGLEGARLIADEQAKFLRRQQVCDRIREAALASGDLELEKQAQLLEQRAWFIYEQRTAQARVPSLLPMDDSLSVSKLTTPKEPKAPPAAKGEIHSILARSPATRKGGED